MSVSYDCWYGVKGPPRVRGGLPQELRVDEEMVRVAPCTRGFADNDPKPPPKRRNSDMKNRAIMVRVLSSDQVARVTEETKNPEHSA